MKFKNASVSIKCLRQKSGMTILETVIGIGLFAVVLLASSSVFTSMGQQMNHFQRQSAKSNFEDKLVSLLRNQNICTCNLGGASPVSIPATGEIEVTGLRSVCTSVANDIYTASADGYALEAGLSVEKITIQTPSMIVDPAMHAKLRIQYKLMAQTGIQQPTAEYVFLYNKTAVAGPPFVVSNCSLTGSSTNTVLSWNLLGNSDVNDTIHFLGTLTDSDVIFRRNGLPGGGIRSNSTSFGLNALASDPAANMVTAVGNLAMQNAFGDGNTAVGYRAMANAANGRKSVAVGANALRLLANGMDNVAIGNQAMQAKTDGNANVGVGYEALHNGSGSENVAVGYFSLRGATTGDSNVAVGSQALLNNDSGSDNVGIGRDSMSNNSSGSGNVAIGSLADMSASGHVNATAIGAGAIATASNMVRLGNAAVTVIQGQVGFSSSSDLRLKEDVKNYEHGLDLILNLRPVTYKFKSDPQHKPHSGFIAQEVEAIKVPFYGLNKPPSQDSFYSLSYAEFVVPLVNSVKEIYAMMQKYFTDFTTEIEDVRAENRKLKQELEELSKRQKALEDLVSKKFSERP